MLKEDVGRQLHGMPVTEVVGDSILKGIGDSLVVRLSRLFPSQATEVLAKLEMLNPGGSVKDRPARYIIERGFAEGSIGPRSHIIESSSGNLAIALAMVCRIYGLRFTAVVDPKIATANLKIIRCYGGEIDMVTQQDSQGGYLETRIHRVRQLIAQTDCGVWINQYANERNLLSHYYGEGEEFVRALQRAPDYLVLGVSTSGTIHGVSRRLKEVWPAMKTIAVDAAGSVLFGAKPQVRDLPGIGASRVPELLNVAEIDRVIHIDDYEAASACRELVLAEGIFAGGSSGAVIAAIRRLIEARRGQPTRVLTILPDRGERYLDSVYDDDWLSRVAARHYAMKSSAKAVSAELVE